ncbi:MAG TPA: enoyl-CoA hydratase/isomerase family protein, partial [Pirellulales bacterium]
VCDAVVASEKATFGLPEVRRGLVAGLAGPLLAFRLGGGPAGYLLTTGRAIDAAQAQRMGLFHEVVPDEHVWVRAAELAAEAGKGAPSSMLMTKRLLNETIGEQLSTLMSVGSAISATARTTDAASEGISAFLEDREPKW